MKKVFGQTVRDIKREVNKKVLKVPGIEQKVLDATSNEPWGPHGSLLADIAQATRNYHEYQMIMTVIWKRINDTGKNWRHVYKALTVLEYLVAHGAERVIDEIREHAYQISALSNFQYIDSSGKDQGNNVRRKSQSLVQLVNDKERIIEVREKAATNRDKFRTTSTGGMYKPGSSYGDRYDDDRYGSRDDDRNGNGYGREREWGYRDDDRSNRDGDRNGRDYEERYSRDGYRDDDYQGRSQSVDDYQYGSRSRSSDRDQDRNYDDNGQHSSRDSNVKAEDHSLEARLEQKLSLQNHGLPPSYEEAVGEGQSPVHNEKDAETSTVLAPRGSSPNANENPSEVAAPSGSSPPLNDNPNRAPPPPVAASTSENQVFEAFDEFDPRGPTEAALTTSNNLEMDFLGSLTESFPSNALALVPATSETTTSQANAQAGSNSAATFAVASSASNNVSQPFEDPFGDSPFKAIPSNETAPSNPQIYQNVEPLQSNGLNAETVSNFGFGDSFSGVTFSTSGAANAQPFSTNSEFSTQDLSTAQEETDILADILPPAPLPAMASHEDIAAAAGQPSPRSFSAAQPTSQFIQHGFSAPNGQPAQQAFSIPSGQIVPLSSPAGQPVQQPFSSPTGQPPQQPFSAPSSHSAVQPFSAPTGQPTQQPFSGHTGQLAHQPFLAPTGQPAHQPFLAPAGQPAQPFSVPTGQPPQQTFSAHTGQPAQQPFSAPTGQSPQQPFSAHTGQPAQQPFLAPTGQPAQQPFSAHTGHQPTQQPFSAHTGHQPTQQPFSAHTGQPAQQPFSAHTGQRAYSTFSYPTDQSMQPSFPAHGGQPAQPTGNIYGGYHSQLGSVTPGAPSVPPQSQNGQINGGMFHPPGSTAPIPSHMASQTPTGQVAQNGNYFPEQGGSITHTNNASQFNGGSFVAQHGTATPFSLLGQAGANAPNASQYAVSSSTGSNSIVPQPSKDKFETKSTVWADTLSRGLVNLNISGPKINPLADIGIDFDAINRKEKRMEKPTTAAAAVTSTVTMGKAMGSGSGIGRAGATALRAPSSPIMGQGMNMGMGMGNNPGIGMGTGGYGGMNPSMGMGMGMGGMGMGMGMGQGVQMQQPTGFPPGSNIPGNYNNHMGAGGYSQQPYGGGYR